MTRPWYLWLIACLAVWAVGVVWHGLTLDAVGDLSIVLITWLLAYDVGWRRGRDRTDIEAWLAADMPTQLGALTIAHLEHPAVTAVVVTRGPRLDGKALYTIAAERDDQ